MSGAKAPNRIGTVIGDRFRVDELIGRGAMAEVYRALDLHTQAFVALKILRHTHVTDAVALARFTREAEVQGRLRHRNVAALLGSGVTDKKEPYLAVELLRGTSLRSVIKNEGRIAPRRAASYAWQALQGLSAVHAAGILHRDLKPANIMLEPSPGPVERVVLIDFGFATFEGSAKLTLQGTVVGSLTYIAPERLRGEDADPRTDLYAIGVILFELLAGHPPFAADDDFELIGLHVHVEPPSLVQLGLPRSLDAVVQIALAKYPGERFPNAAAMADALEQAAQDLM
ncbi:MAG TPA: serine/threonine-protein kinase [Kofleriaceae bacterium]|nr:serine/threonine-protein kinase [Kofleriaceae bacterium]